jgi:hypothetical protein
LHQSVLKHRGGCVVVIPYDDRLIATGSDLDYGCAPQKVRMLSEVISLTDKGVAPDAGRRIGRGRDRAVPPKLSQTSWKEVAWIDG